MGISIGNGGGFGGHNRRGRKLSAMGNGRNWLSKQLTNSNWEKEGRGGGALLNPMMQTEN